MKLVTTTPGLRETPQITRVREYLQKHGGYKFVRPPTGYDPNKPWYDQTEAVQKRHRNYKRSLVGEVVELTTTRGESAVVQREVGTLFRVGMDQMANFALLKRLLQFQTSGKRARIVIDDENTHPFPDDALHTIISFFSRPRDYFNLRSLCRDTRAALDFSGAVWATENIEFSLSKSWALKVNSPDVKQKPVIDYIATLWCNISMDFCTVFPSVLRLICYIPTRTEPRVPYPETRRRMYREPVRGLLNDEPVTDGDLHFTLPPELKILELYDMEITKIISREILNVKPRNLCLRECVGLPRLKGVGKFLRDLDIVAYGREKGEIDFYQQPFPVLARLRIDVLHVYELFKRIEPMFLVNVDIIITSGLFDLSPFLQLQSVRVECAVSNKVSLAAFVNRLSKIGNMRKLVLHGFQPAGNTECIFPGNLEDLRIKCFADGRTAKIGEGISNLKRLRRLHLSRIAPAVLSNESVSILWVKLFEWSTLEVNCPAVTTLRLVCDREHDVTPESNDEEEEGEEDEEKEKEEGGMEDDEEHPIEYEVPMRLINTFANVRKLILKKFWFPAEPLFFSRELVVLDLSWCHFMSDVKLRLPDSLKRCKIVGNTFHGTAQIVFNPTLVSLKVDANRFGNEQGFANLINGLGNVRNMTGLLIRDENMNQARLRQLTTFNITNIYWPGGSDLYFKTMENNFDRTPMYFHMTRLGATRYITIPAGACGWLPDGWEEN